MDWNLTQLPNWGKNWVESVDIADLTREVFFEKYVKNWRPVIIRNACRDWPARTKWTVEYIRSHWGHVKVPIHVRTEHQESRHPDAPAEFLKAYVQGTVSSVLDATENTSLRYHNLDKDSPVPEKRNSPLQEMLKDFGDARIVSDTPPPISYARTRIFLYRGGLEPWHDHQTDEHLTHQVLGKKRFAFLGPTGATQAATLERARNELDIMDVDTSKYPEYGQMMPGCAELDAGDSVYIPPLWWHAVQPVDQSVGATVAFTWATDYRGRSTTAPPADQVFKRVDASEVKFPATVEVHGSVLALNGSGVRKGLVNAYVAGLYLQTRSNDPSAILSCDHVRRLDMVMLRPFASRVLEAALNLAFDKNNPNPAPALVERCRRLFAAIPSLQPGQMLSFIYVPGDGTSVQGPSAHGTVEGKDVADAVFGLWLGANPIDDGLKAGLLGASL